jgi:hypothetical protein
MIQKIMKLTTRMSTSSTITNEINDYQGCAMEKRRIQITVFGLEF